MGYKQIVVDGEYLGAEPLFENMRFTLKAHHKTVHMMRETLKVEILSEVIDRRRRKPFTTEAWEDFVRKALTEKNNGQSPQKATYTYWGRKIRQVVCQIPARIVDEIRELPSHEPKDKEVVALVRHSRRRGDVPDVSYGIWDEKDEEASVLFVDSVGKTHHTEDHEDDLDSDIFKVAWWGKRLIGPEATTFPRPDRWMIPGLGRVDLPTVGVSLLTRHFTMKRFVPPKATEEAWRSRIATGQWDFKLTWAAKSFFVSPRDEITILKLQHRTLFTAQRDAGSDGKCATGCDEIERQQHLAECPIIWDEYWKHVIELLCRVGAAVPLAGRHMTAYLTLFRVTDDHGATSAEVGILTLAWRCLYAETVGAHIDKRVLKLGRALKRLGNMLRSRLRAYGEKWKKWVESGRDREDPHVIPQKHHNKQVIDSDWVGEYIIHPAVENMAEHGEPTGRWESPDRKPPEEVIAKRKEEAKDRQASGAGRPSRAEIRTVTKKKQTIEAHRRNLAGDARTPKEARERNIDHGEQVCFAQDALAAARNFFRCPDLDGGCGPPHTLHGPLLRSCSRPSRRRSFSAALASRSAVDECELMSLTIHSLSVAMLRTRLSSVGGALNFSDRSSARMYFFFSSARAAGEDGILDTMVRRVA